MGRLSALRDHSLSIVFGVLLLAALTGQALTGMAGYNEQALDLGLPQVGLAAYVTSSEFAVDVAENWQSEYLQFFLYIVATVWLVQRGSPESKPLARRAESDKEQLVGRARQRGLAASGPARRLARGACTPTPSAW